MARFLSKYSKSEDRAHRGPQLAAQTAGMCRRRWASPVHTRTQGGGGVVHHPCTGICPWKAW
jgi:hypothetical protein